MEILLRMKDLFKFVKKRKINIDDLKINVSKGKKIQMLLTVNKNYVYINPMLRMFMHKILYLCLLISLPLSTYSQQLKGKVFNEQNQPLENVLITVKPLNSESLQYTVSNRDGDFSISKLDNGIYEIVIKSVGYLTFIDTVTVNGDTSTGEIVLMQKIIELDGVTVISEIPAIRNTGNSVVVNVDDSYFRSLPSVTDVLAQIPEISIDDGVISVLGKKSIGYYVNGKQTGFNPAGIAVASIDRIELITSPSAKYDGNMEAVINIVLKKNSEQGFNGEISAQYEQRSKPQYDLSNVFNYNRGIFNSTVTLNHDYSVSAGVKTVAEQKFYSSSNPFVRKYVQNSRSRSHSEIYGAEFSLNFSETNVLSFQATWQPNYVPFSHFEQQNDFISNAGQQPDSASVSEVDWKYHTRFANAGLKYDFKINRLNMDVQFDWLWQDDLTNTDNRFDFENFSTVDNMALQTRQFRKSAAYVPSLNGNYDFGISRLDFGVKYYFVESLLNLDFSENNTFTPESDFAYDATENIFAVYGVFNSKIKRLTYEIGIRGEFSTLKGNFNIQNTNQTLNEFLPSVSISYSIKNNRSISLSYKKNILRPPFSRISPLYYFTGPFDAYEGNPNLKPAVLSSFQLKYLFGNKSVTLLYNSNKDMMGTFPFIRNNITVQKFVNYNQTVMGAVLGLPVKHASWLNGQYSLRLYSQTVENMDAGSTFKAKILTSGVNIIENVKLPKAYTVNILFDYSLPKYVGADKIKNYPDINFSFVKNFNDNLSISLYLRDIFKISNRSITSRDLDGINFYSTSYWDSRGVNISLTYKFQKGRQTNTKTFNPDEIGDRL
jgi:hypothetical protein